MRIERKEDESEVAYARSRSLYRRTGSEGPRARLPLLPIQGRGGATAQHRRVPPSGLRGQVRHPPGPDRVDQPRLLTLRGRDRICPACRGGVRGSRTRGAGLDVVGRHGNRRARGQACARRARGRGRRGGVGGRPGSAERRCSLAPARMRRSPVADSLACGFFTLRRAESGRPAQRSARHSWR